MLKLLFLIISLVFPFGQLVSIPVIVAGYELRVHPLDLLAFITVFYWLIFFKNKHKISKYLIPLVLFATVCLFSFLIKFSFTNIIGNIPSFFYLLRLFVWIAFIFASFDFLKTNKFNVKKILVIEGLIIGLFSFFQYLLLPDTRFLQYSGWDDHLYRAIGSFLDPSFSGLFLVLALISAFDYFFNEKNKIKTVWKFLYIIFMIVCIVLTFSRMTYGLLIVFLISWLFKSKKIKTVFTLLFLSVLILIAAPKPAGEGVKLLRKSSFIAKSDNYSEVISITKDNFLFGIGYNNLRSEYFKRGYLSEKNWLLSHSGSGADNSFLFIFATTGVIGFILYFYYWLTIFRLIISKKNFFVFSTALCLIFSSFFINSLFYPWVFCWWGIVLADFMAGIEA